MSKQTTIVNKSALLSAPTYRDFLRVYLDSVDQSLGKPLSYAEFSRRAGLESRSFPRDVITGKRRLTAKTVSVFARALDLSDDWKEYFRLLVGKSEPDTLSEKWGLTQLEAELERLRRRLTRRQPRSTSLGAGQAPSLVDQLCVYPELPRVYASLGSEESGATEEEIVARTGISLARAQEILKRMSQLQLADWHGGTRWVPLSFHVALTGVKKSEFFAKLFESALSDAKQASAKLMDSDENLFMTSAICVAASDLPKFKSRLRELILSFVDDSENAEGDAVVQLTCSLHR